METQDGYDTYRVAFYGLKFQLLVGSELPAYFDELDLVRTGRIVVADVRTGLLPAIASLMNDVFANGGLRTGKRTERRTPRKVT